MKAERVPIRSGGIAVKTKLLGAVALLMVFGVVSPGTAQADTVPLSWAGQGGLYQSITGSGSMTVSGDSVTSVQLMGNWHTIAQGSDYVVLEAVRFNAGTSADPVTGACIGHSAGGCHDGMRLNFSSSFATLMANGGTISGWASLYDAGFSIEITGMIPPQAVPLPAGLPLFVTGLGALGLLGWRRKRKAQAAA